MADYENFYIVENGAGLRLNYWDYADRFGNVDKSYSLMDWEHFDEDMKESIAEGMTDAEIKKEKIEDWVHTRFVDDFEGEYVDDSFDNCVKYLRKILTERYKRIKRGGKQ